MKRWAFLVLAAFGVLWFTACHSEGDDAKKRVTEKQDIVEKVKHREVTLTQIDLAKIPQDEAEMVKLLLMTQEEVAERMGDYSLDTFSAYETGQGEKTLKLSETSTLVQRKNGDFHLTVSNDKSNQVDMYWVGGKLINKIGGGDLHESQSVGKHLFWREKLFETFDRFVKTFHGHLAFAKEGEETVNGRSAIKMKISLKPNGVTPEEGLPLQYKLPGQYQISVKGTEKLLNGQRKRIGKFIQADGTLWIDREKAVILKYAIEGRYSIPIAQKKKDELLAKGKEPGPDVMIALRSTYEIKDIGKEKVITAPPAKPPMQRRQPDLDPLDFAPDGVQKTPEAKIEPAKKGNTPGETATPGEAASPATPEAPAQLDDDPVGTQGEIEPDMTDQAPTNLPAALSTLLTEERYLLPLALRCLDEKKAERLLVYDVHEEGSYCDYVVICHGTSDRQVQALAEHVQETLNKTLGELPLGTEGEQLNHWRLLDYGGTVINIFYEPLRDYYNLEGIWTSKPGVAIEPLIEAFNEVEAKEELPPRKSRKQTRSRVVDGMPNLKF